MCKNIYMSRPSENESTMCIQAYITLCYTERSFFHVSWQIRRDLFLLMRELGSGFFGDAYRSGNGYIGSNFCSVLMKFGRLMG